jgi:hypothetical protein
VLEDWEEMGNSHPTPASFAAYTVHFHDGVCEQTRESTCDGSGAEEEALALRMSDFRIEVGRNGLTHWISRVQYHIVR